MSQPRNEGTAPASNGDTADRLLVERCLAGDGVTWLHLNERLWQRMKTIAFKALGRDAANKALVEEIAVDIMSSFFLNRRLLQAHLIIGHNLNGYLDFLIYRAVKNYYRHLTRQKRHEMHLSDIKLAEPSEMILPADFRQELLEILTPAEKNYLLWLERPAPLARACPYGRSYARQLAHRIVHKVHSLFTRG